MSNKPHPASHDAIAADAGRLAANDAHDAHEAGETTPEVTPAVTDEATPVATPESRPEAPVSEAHESEARQPNPAPDVVAPSAAPAVAEKAADLPLTSPGGVGARLAYLRESRRWSIEDVSTRLKVPPNKLRAIEAGDLSLLPDMTFTLGVIRAYAKLLGVDAAPLTGALRQSTGPIEQNLSMPAARGGGLPRAAKSPTMSLGGPPKRRPWAWGIGAVVLAVVVLLLYRNGTEPSAWLAKLKPMTEPAVGASAAAASGASSADAPAEASGDAPGAASDTQGPADSNAAASATTGAATVAPAPAVGASTPAAQTLAAVAAAGSTPSAASAPVKASAAVAASAPADAPVPVDGQQSIHISVNGDSWVSVREAGGKEVLSGLMHAGDAKDAVGKPPLQFVIGNNKGIDALEVNGAAVDPSKYANAKGNVARFTLP